VTAVTSDKHEPTKEEAARMRKPDYDIHPLFVQRWSPRAFAAAPVRDQDLFAVLEAARWAPSAANEQPWRFIVARSDEEKKRFRAFINEGNLRWCTAAPVLLLVLSDRTMQSGRDNRAHAFDAGAAWGYLALEAANRGLITHPMGGFDREAARQALGVPDLYDLHAVVALGYRGDPAALPDDLKAREQPSQRRPALESAFAGRFGVPLG
jgi:nitroreductase